MYRAKKTMIDFSEKIVFFRWQMISVFRIATFFFGIVSWGSPVIIIIINNSSVDTGTKGFEALGRNNYLAHTWHNQKVKYGLP